MKQISLLLVVMLFISSCLTVDYPDNSWIENDQHNYRLTKSTKLFAVASPRLNRLRLVLSFPLSFMYFDFYETKVNDFTYIVEKYFEWDSIANENNISDNSKVISIINVAAIADRINGEKPITMHGYFGEYSETHRGDDHLYHYQRKISFSFVRKQSESFLVINLPARTGFHDATFTIDYKTMKELCEVRNEELIIKRIKEILEYIKNTNEEKNNEIQEKEKEKELFT